MTQHPDLPGRRREPAPLVHLAPVVRVGAGSRTTVEVHVTNAAEAPRRLAVMAVGVDGEWLPDPVRTHLLAPGETTVVGLDLAPSVGTMPAQYPLAVTVQALVPHADPLLDRAADAPTGVGETVLVVNPRARLTLTAEPTSATAVRSERLRVRLRNEGATPVEVDLDRTATPGLDVRLRRRRVLVPAGGEIVVRGRLVATRPRRIGARQQHSWSVTATTSEIVRRAGGTLTQRPVLGPAWVRVAAVLAIVGVWAAVAFTVVPVVADRINGKDEEGVTEATLEGGGGPGGSGEGGENGAGGTAPGPGGSEVDVSRAETAASRRGLSLNGTVTGTDPTGVTVRLSRESLTSPRVEDAVPVGFEVDLAANGKTPATSLLVRVPGRVPDDRSVTTSDQGTWSFARVRAPGFFLLTFSKLGFATQKYVIDAAKVDPAEPLEIEMVPGTGTLSGTVAGPGGPVGGATVVISDGTNTLTTSTESTGAGKGTWAVDGLSSPGAYVVQASADGLGAESVLVKLAAEGSARADLRLGVGAALLSGFVSEASASARRVGGTDGGIGGIDVVVTDAEGTTRTATTATASEASAELEGRFQVPALPPGDYTVTFSGEGYLAQTQRVVIEDDEGEEQVTAQLRSSYGRVTGVVGVIDPQPSDPPITNAGLVLSNDTQTYKTTATSQDKGAFDFSNVDPGVYTLSTTLFGFEPSVLTVEVPAGGLARAFPQLKVIPGGGLAATSLIRGAAIEAASGDPIFCEDEPAPPPGSPPGTAPLKEPCLTATTEVRVDDTTTDAVDDTFRPNEEYTLPRDDDPDREGLEPGVYEVTVSAPHYETGSVVVQVPLSGEAVAPTVQLFSAPKITGTITSGAGVPSAGTCVWAVPAGRAFSSACETGQGLEACSPTPVAPEENPPVVATRCALVPNGIGDYSIEVPRRGDYDIYVDAGDDEFLPVAPQRINAPIGGTATYDVRINRYGVIVITALQAGTTGALETAPNARITATLMQGSPAAPTGPSTTLTADANGTVTFTALASGLYEITALSDPTVVPQRSSEPVYLDISDNQEKSKVVAMVERVDRIVVRAFHTSEGGASGTGIANAQVQITAPSGYQDTTPVNTRVTLTTNSQGCAAVVRDAPSPTVPGPLTDCTAAYTTDVHVRRFGFLSTTASQVVVRASGYEDYIATNKSLSEPVNNIQLIPLPVSFSGSIAALGAPSDIPWDQISFQVLNSSGAQADSITLRAGPGGALTWTDSRLSGPNLLRPGVYTVTASLPGYTGDTKVLRCSTPATPCSFTSLELRRFGSLVLRPLDASAAVIDGATVELLRNGAVVETRTTTSAGATFPDLVPVDPTPAAGVSDPTYTVRVRAGGYRFESSPTLTCDTGPDPQTVRIEAGAPTTCGTPLTQLATLTGTLTGIAGKPPATSPSSLLAGATVLAQRCSTTATASGRTYCTEVDRTLSNATDASGVFRITGTNAVEGVTTGTWVLVPQASGYTVPLPNDAPSGAIRGEVVEVTTNGDVTQDLTVYLNPVDLTVRVTDQFDKRVASATVELLRGTVSVATGDPSGSGMSTTFEFDDVVPGVYTLKVSGSGLVTSTGQVQVFDNPPQQSHEIFVSRAANRVQGRVVGSDAPSGVGGARVEVLTCTSSTGPCGPDAGTGVDDAAMAKDTDSTGAFEFVSVPNGYAQVRAAKTGYEPETSSIFLLDSNGAAAPVVSFTLDHVRRDVTVTVTATEADDDLAGTEVTLVARPAGSNTDQTVPVVAVPAPGSGWTASFTGVRHGCYDLDLTLPPNHYGEQVPPVRTSGEGGCTGHVVVPVDAGQPVQLTPAPSVEVREKKLTVTVAATQQPGHPVPTTVTLAIAAFGISDSAFAVSYTPTGGPAVTGSTLEIWAPPGTHPVTADPGAGFAPFWPPGTIDAVVDLATAGPVSVVVPLTELTGAVEVTAAGATNGSRATITVAAHGSQTATVPPAYVTGVETSGNPNTGKVTLDLPSGCWVLNGTRTTGGGATVTYGPQTIYVGALTSSVTLGVGAATTTPPECP